MQCLIDIKKISQRKSPDGETKEEKSHDHVNRYFKNNRRINIHLQ
jgi:hypothetical protein